MLDTHLDLLDTDIPSISFLSIVSSRRLQDMPSKHLEDKSSRRLQDVFKTNKCLLGYTSFTFLFILSPIVLSSYPLFYPVLKRVDICIFQHLLNLFPLHQAAEFISIYCSILFTAIPQHISRYQIQFLYLCCTVTLF